MVTPENQAQEQYQKNLDPRIRQPQSNAPQKNKNAFHLGVFVETVTVNGKSEIINNEDIIYYNEEFRKINELYGDKIKLIFYGYKKDEDELDILKGVSYGYCKPVSIIHFPKQLKDLDLDLLFIPLIYDIKTHPKRTRYNVTSENYNKFLEVGLLFKTPILTINMFPYNVILNDKVNSFIYPSKETFMEYFKDLFENKRGIIELCGSHLHDLVVKDFNFSEQNIKLLSSVFSVPTPKHQTQQ